MNYKIGFFLLLGILTFVTYANYDYWVFKILIANNYVFTDTLDEFYSRHISEENRRGFYRDFDRVVISAVTAEFSEINNDGYTQLHSPQEVREIRETEKEIAKSAEVFAINDDTVYLFVPNISRISRKFICENRDYMAQYPKLVLDLRGNYGGRLTDFRRIASLFVPYGEVISRQEARLFSREIKAGSKTVFEFENIVILQNKYTASAAESLIMALSEHLDSVVTIGQTTFGKGTGQVVIPLRGGYALRATVLRVFGPNQSHFTAVEPDVTVPPPLFLQALRYL
jgi:hypothetical protein